MAVMGGRVDSILPDSGASIRPLVPAPEAILMLRLAVLLSVFIAMTSVAMAQDAQEAKPDTVEVHGKALALSCAEWKRNPDRSWTSIGELMVGAEAMNVTLRGGKETSVLEAKCGGDQEPIATPVKSAEPVRHARHGHHHGETTTADGT
jgi:hypothetical protein